MQIWAEFARRFVFDIAIIGESVLSWHQVVLAAPKDEITGVFERLQEHGFVGLQHVKHSAVAADVRIPAGHKRAAAWCADGILAESVAEGDGVGFDDLVEIRV